jgi:eukaryotic-like serine/threonine-protein kinase
MNLDPATGPDAARAPSCAACGGLLEPEALQGLCARCLLGQAFAFAVAASEGDVIEAERVAAAGLEGRTLGGYEILSTIARGGMGVVFKARQRNPRRIVALKVIAAGELASPRAVERFHNEALAAARLDHPNIVPIHEVGEDRGWHYFSMQLVEGCTLADLIRTGRPEPQAAVELLRVVTRAVEHAHQRGILHRDLKPTNILLDATGDPHLTDFGLAKVVEEESDLTLTHAMLGTPAYMSPEQAAGRSRDITTATDVYGLGAIFFELLSGRPPFSAESTPTLLRKIAEEEPSLDRARIQAANRSGRPASELADLSVICLKCLEKDPSKRYATAGDLAGELDRWLLHEPIHARPANALERGMKWVRRHRARAAVLATVTLALLAVAAISAALGLRVAREGARNRQHVVHLNLAAGERRANDQDPTLAALYLWEAWQTDRPDPGREDLHRRRLGILLRNAPRLEWIARHTGAVNAVRFSPDGRWVASASEDRSARFWDPASGLATGEPMPHAASVSTAFFSPDGTRLATLSADQSLRLWEVPTGRLLLGPLPANDFRFKRPTSAATAFSPDGKQMIVAHGKIAEVRDGTTGEALGRRIEHGGRINTAQFSPDGTSVLTVCDAGEARLWDAVTGEARIPRLKLYRAQANQWSAGVLSADGEHLLLYANSGEATLWNARTGQSVAITLGDATKSVVQAGFNADGRIGYSMLAESSIRFWEPTQGHLLEPRRLPDHNSDPALAMADLRSDSRMALLAGWSGGVSLLGIQPGQPDGPVLRHADLVYFAAFSPDGQKVVSGDRSGLVRLWSPREEGAAFSLRHGASIVSADFSPDGSLIMTAGGDGRVRRWRTRTAEPFGPTWQMGGAVTHAVFSPTGNRLAVANLNRPTTIWDASAETNTEPAVRLTAQGHWISFSPDGTRLLTLGRDEDGIGHVGRLWDAATGKPVGSPMPHPQLPVLGEFSPDGTSILTAASDWRLRRFDTVTGKAVAEPFRFNGWIREAHFSPDGRHLLSGNSSPGYDARDALLFALDSTNPVVRFTGHRNGVNQAVFSPDGTRVATGSFDSSARIWDARTGQPLSPPLQHPGQLTRVLFSPDGRLLATASVDGTARVWDGLSGDPVSPPLRHRRSIRVLAFSPDSLQLLSAGDDGVARVWDLSPASGTPEELRQQIQLLSAHALDAAGNPRPLRREEIGRLWERTRNAGQRVPLAR